MTTKEFVEKLDKDTELFNKAKSFKTCDEMYELAKVNGVIVDIDTFVKEFKACIDSYKNMSEEEIKVAAAGNVYGSFLKPGKDNYWIIG